ncbi:MAG TPA: DUF1295 domain-containing protein [Pseudonocardia sp.]
MSVLDYIGLTMSGGRGEVFLICCIWTFAVVTLLWVAGLFQGNHSMMDGYYGFGFAVPAWFAFWLAPGARTQVAALLLLMVSLHGCRLGWYLASRWRRYARKYGGDPRYLGFKQKYTPGYWWKSFFCVMEPQAVVIVLIGSPAAWGILANQREAARPGLLCVLGLLVFAVGFYFETVADAQLQAFLADPNNKGRYLQTGVWTHSRHPNYFGNTAVWWGIWIVAVSGNPQAWWTVIGPIANTFMLTRVLGSAFQDKYMGDRPEYQRLMARTRAFLPLPLAKRTPSDSAPRDTETESSSSGW